MAISLHGTATGWQLGPLGRRCRPLRNAIKIARKAKIWTTLAQLSRRVLRRYSKRVESTDNFATRSAGSAPCAPDRDYARLRLASPRHFFGGQLLYLSFEPSGHRAGAGERSRLGPAAHRNRSGDARSQLPRKKRRAKRSCARPSRIAVASLSCRSRHAHSCIALLTKAVRPCAFDVCVSRFC
jgi:hypothetical protein